MNELLNPSSSSSSSPQVLQKLGKADETRDTAFEELVTNFNKQMVRSRFLHDLVSVAPLPLLFLTRCASCFRLKAPNCRGT